MTDQPSLTRLDNGVRVASQSMPHLATATVGIWVDVGARYETEDVNGVAHLLEHMAFKGTERRSAQRIGEEIEAVGGQLNAYTAREQTAYYARILAADVPLAVDLLADIVRHSTCDEAELERERTVVLQEIGQVQDTPDDLVFDLFQEQAFPSQPLGRSILGPVPTVERLSRIDLLGYLRTHYAPERLIVAGAGKVEHDRLVELAQRHLGDLAAQPPVAMDRAIYRGGARFDRDDLEQVHVVLGLPGVAFDDPDFYAAQVLAAALGGGMSSRLFQEIREKRGLAYNVFAFATSYVDCGLLGMYAATSAADAPEVVGLIEAETRALVAAPGAAELGRARAQLKASLLMSLENCASLAEEIARQHLIFGNYLGPESIAERIDAVDAAALRRVGARMLRGPWTFTALGPIQTGLEAAVARIGMA